MNIDDIQQFEEKYMKQKEESEQYRANKTRLEN